MMKSLKIFLSLLLVGLALATCNKDKGMPTVTDVDGNVYHTVKIGTQTWMVENLKTTHYRNGDAIDNPTDNMVWANTTKGAYADLSAVANFAKIYGHLYNWYAVSDARSIAPEGWHVPSDAEWTTLTDFLGGANTASGPLREAGTAHWASPNTGASNSSGFRALPAGIRGYNGVDGTQDWKQAFFWATTEFDSGYSFVRELNLNSSTEKVFNSDVAKTAGLSVRCIKD